MSTYTLYSETLPDYKKYSYTYLDAQTLQEMDAGAALAPSKLRLENYRQESGIIDAVDIDWKGIKVGDVEVQSSGHLAYLISQKSNASNNNQGNTSGNDDSSGSDDGSGSGNNNQGNTIIYEGGVGIPVLDKELIDGMTESDTLPDKYISIPTPEEIEQQIDDPIQYTSSGNGYYLDILFSSLRKLQSEVAKLKNSFKYGIYSYNDTDTAMSTILNDMERDIENEPLWATEESDLSAIDCGLYLTGVDNGLYGYAGSEITLVDNDVLHISGTASWTDNDTMKNDVDTKQYIFMTTDNLNCVIKLKSLDIENEITIDLSQLNVHHVANKKYNVLFIVSRSYKDTKTNQFNENTYNFVWISIADYLTGVAQVEGYYNKNTGKCTSTPAIISNTNDRYYIYNIEFNDITLYKFNTYTKKQDFSNTVVPAPAATDDDYKYSVAHLTVRSVKTLTVLEQIKEQLPKNELIYVENINALYIKTGGVIKQLLGGSNNTNPNTNTDDTGMEKYEIIEWLADNGIIVTEEGGELRLNDISDITLIHEDTGKKFQFKTDANGNLRSNEIIDEQSLETRISKATDFNMNVDNNTNIRGFVGTLNIAESNKRNESGNAVSRLNITGDVGLLSDRIKIGQIYMPQKGQIAYGCSHAFIELENTGDKDFQLDGCYLHFAQNSRVDIINPDETVTKGTDDIHVYHLALEGKIPAGGTYLIRGKQYCDVNEANTFIKVNTFDKEWYIEQYDEKQQKYVKVLIDLSRETQNTFLLTYGLPDVSYKTAMFGSVQIGGTKYTGFNPHYIDSVSIGIAINDVSSDKSSWEIKSGIAKFTNVAYDAIFKNIYELDPAKQAYQSLMSEKKDSSRTRGQNATDFQILDLRDEYIEFPFSDEKQHMSVYTPKASFEHKNVCTDKTQLDMNKPNMLSVSFGIDIYKTRCFNWVSAGLFDEYIWIREKGTDTWYRYESYKSSQSYNDNATNNIVRKTYSNDINNIIYARITNTLPASNIVYTSHKLILNIGDGNPSSKTTYEYVAGRADKNGNFDTEHCSDIQEFTLYPKSYKMRIYQHTDQQAFMWVEYQAWTGAANKMLEVIEYDCAHENIIPVLINTGDMTQNGTRINEWIDYYNAGKCLFTKYEQLAVVGNNDLCDTNVTILGTGDDSGKSNGYYFHIAYCFEIDEDIVPIVNGKYVPSTYYVCGKDYAIVCIDSEVTMINCSDWFNIKYHNLPVNIYTGYTIPSADETPEYAVGSGEGQLNFTPIYDQLYAIFNKLINTKHFTPANVICACHEMPFTVVTNANLKYDVDTMKADRSLNGSSLVGSHMNRINNKDAKGLYWFSRLIEYYGIKLMIGGHKHTYACTLPLRENYEYDYDASTQKYLKDSVADGPMTMQPTLENDNINWKRSCLVKKGNNITLQEVNTTKLPIYVTDEDKSAIVSGDSTFYPVYYVKSSNSITSTEPDSSESSDSSYTQIDYDDESYYDEHGNYKHANKGIIYFMLQATGFKLKSNKELPSNSQLFNYIIPKTKHKDDGTDGPDGNQQYPMFAKIDLTDRYIVLCRVAHILNDSYAISQQSHGDGNMKIHIVKHEDGGNGLIYGKWYTKTGSEEGIAIENLNINNALLTF